MSARAAHRGLRSTSGVLAPADRHFRRPDVRPGRRRRLGQRLWQAARLSGAALVAAAAVLWVGQAVLGSSLLDVDRVIVRGNQRLSAADVDALLVDLRGRHILEVNLTQYERRLLESPWIASVTLWRLLPSTVEVSVVERRPIATARLGDQLYLVDADGVIVDEFGPQYRDLDLPIVDGLMRRPGDGASIVDQDRVALTTRLLASLDSRPDLARRLSQVDTTNLHDVVVLLDGDTALLHLGDGQFVERLTRYLELAPALGESFVDIDYVDLRFERLFVKAAGRAEADAVVRRP
jgi:cell division septal protein FtsQ